MFFSEMRSCRARLDRRRAGYLLLHAQNSGMRINYANLRLKVRMDRLHEVLELQIQTSHGV